MTSVTFKAFAGLAYVLVITGALLFLPAWTLDYPQAWVFLGLFGAAAVAITLYLQRHDPKLLERRVQGGPQAEKRTTQNMAMTFASLSFMAIPVVCALDHRFGWSIMLPWVEIAGILIFLTGWSVIFFVFRENSFASATIELAADQKVISSGPYAVLRHPMYSGATLYLIGMPLILGSWWGLVPVLVMIPTLIWRLFDEEAFLSENLPGYADYLLKVRHRLVPYIW